MSVYLIAEAASCHEGSYDTAVLLCEAAAEAGCDAVKFQIIDEPVIFKLYGPAIPKGLRPFDRRWMTQLEDHCEKLGIDLLATPFDVAGVELCPPPYVKIASRSVDDIELLAAVNSLGIEVLVSMGSLTEPDGMRHGGIFETMARLPNCQVHFLHCISHYPARIEELKLGTYICGGFRAGLSDHTTSLIPPVVAVSLGARYIEKHLCLSRDQWCPDVVCSLTPDEMARMVRMVREAEACL